MPGIVIQILPVRKLNDFTQIHDGNPIADMTDYGQVVGNEQICQIKFLLELFKEVNDLSLD